jgi:O-antigen ligase
MKLFNKKTLWIFTIILALEALSLAGFFYPPFKIVGLVVIGVGALILSWKNLEYGLLLLFIELIIGSKGHLFDFSIISARMLIFTAIMAVFLLRLFKKEEREKIVTYFKELKSAPAIMALAFFVLFGLINALIRHNNFGDIFADINSWLFFLLLFPMLSVYFKASQETYNRLIIVSGAAFLWLSFETLLILYIYSHNLSIMPTIYLWLRKTGIAEITATTSGFPRIFLQSQIYAAVAIIISTFSLKQKGRDFWIIAILAWSVLFLSMSRSFWLATAICLFIGLVIQRRIILKNLFFIIGTSLSAAVLIFLISVFPIPKPGLFSLDSFINRANLDNNEAAVASRWALLPALSTEIRKNPIIGQGYGAGVTYKSSDPRVLEQHPDGWYTTYAFEWGYLSIWLKLGILGLLAYLWLLGQNIYRGIKKNNFFALVLLLLATVHALTPYLDHPLGIALVMMAIIVIPSCVKTENKVY